MCTVFADSVKFAEEILHWSLFFCAVASSMKTEDYNLHVRSSNQRCSIKKGVLRNFAKSAGKHLCQSLFFGKVAGACNFIKKETLAQEFSSGFCKFLRTPFVQNTLERQLLECSQGYQQMQLPWDVSQDRYCENFAKILRKHSWWNLPFLQQYC